MCLLPIQISKSDYFKFLMSSKNYASLNDDDGGGDESKGLSHNLPCCSVGGGSACGSLRTALPSHARPSCAVACLISIGSLCVGYSLGFTSPATAQLLVKNGSIPQTHGRNMSLNEQDISWFGVSALLDSWEHVCSGHLLVCCWFCCIVRVTSEVVDSWRSCTLSMHFKFSGSNNLADWRNFLWLLSKPSSTIWHVDMRVLSCKFALLSAVWVSPSLQDTLVTPSYLLCFVSAVHTMQPLVLPWPLLFWSHSSVSDLRVMIE